MLLYVFICGGHHDSDRMAVLVIVSKAESIVLYFILYIYILAKIKISFLPTSVVVAEINNSIYENGCRFVKWPPLTSKWLIPSTDTYDKMYVFSSTFF